MTGRAILVVDDERLSRASTVKQLEALGYRARAAGSAEEALEVLESESWDVVLSDIRMPGMDGIELLDRIKSKDPRVEVILMTAFASVEAAVRAMQLGAADYLTKPFHFSELELRLEKIFRDVENRDELENLRHLFGSEGGEHGLLGSSPAMRLVRDRIEAFAARSAPVLITGETGTGKEVVARALHAAGNRARREFVAVGCGTIPKELAESELFGHEKGSFTGATGQKKGSFERADGGTLLLDDIDDLPLDIQVKLLRVLQEGTIVRVGGSAELQVDVRVIATTKVDLARAVEEGKVRPDILYRLRGLEIALPPLRERIEDLATLAKHFLQQIAAEEGGSPKALSAEALRVLEAYAWPGNVRELRRAMESCMAVCRGDSIEVVDLPPFVLSGGASAAPFTLNEAALSDVCLPDLVQDFEERLVTWAMREAGGNQSKAARLLGVPRTTLQSKLGERNLR